MVKHLQPADLDWNFFRFVQHDSAPLSAGLLRRELNEAVPPTSSKDIA
jgi:hypothetical protein